MLNRIVAGIVLMGMCWHAAGVMASVPSDDVEKARITSIRSDADEKGIMVALNHRMPFQLIQVDDRELLLAVKSGVWEEGLPVVDVDDVLVASVSFDRLPGDIIGLMIHTKKPVAHDSTEWNDATGHVMVRLK